MPLGEQVALDSLQPPDHLVRQAAELGEVAPDRLDLLAQAVLEGVVDPRGQGRLDPGRGLDASSVMGANGSVRVG